MAIACFSFALAMSGQPNKASHNKGDSTTQSDPPVTNVATISPTGEAQQQQGKPNNDPPKGNAPVERSHWYSNPDWWLLGATLLTAGVIAYQSYFTKIAAEAADAAAAASLKQTEHMADIERPFLMIEFRSWGEGSYEFFAFNYGRSPAQLIFINNIPHVTVTKFGAELEDKPWYGFGFYEEGMMVINEPWIPPGKEVSLGVLDAEVIRMWVDGHPELNMGEKELLVRGAIKYRGRFSEDIWHSKYCYRVFPKVLRMAGPYGWNDYS